jgi:hypothetical protein
MSTIYHIADGLFQPRPEQRSPLDERANIVPVQRVQLPLSRGPDQRPRSTPIHLIRALLNGD